jgi:antitoxin component YwqK of YwqJK toxin-antitoxin module
MIYLFKVNRSITLLLLMCITIKNTCQILPILPLQVRELKEYVSLDTLSGASVVVNPVIDDSISLCLAFNQNNLVFQGLKFNNRRHGAQYSYFESGEIRTLEVYDRDCPNGIYVEFDKDGNLLVSGEFICLDADTVIFDTLQVENRMTGDNQIVKQRIKGYSVKSGIWIYMDIANAQMKRQLWFKGALVREESYQLVNE